MSGSVVKACSHCERYLHIKDCPGCGRSCKCYEVREHPAPGDEPLTAKWEKDILKAFIQRHGAANVQEAVAKLEAQLG